MEDGLYHFWWGNYLCEWTFASSVGSRGGIISVWCSSNEMYVFSFTELGFIGICLDWRGVVNAHCFVVNVYSKWFLNEKRLKWNKLMHVKGFISGHAWCVVNDFTSVLTTSKNEKGGSGEFGNFIFLTGLPDLPLLCHRFNLFQPNSGAMSKLDCFLMSDGWVSSRMPLTTVPSEMRGMAMVSLGC